MALLKLVLVVIAFSFLNITTFYNLIIISLFLKIIYKMNFTSVNDSDPIMLMVNITNIFMHLISYQISNFISKVNNNIFSYILTKYNYWNNKFIKLKSNIISYPMKFFMKKLINNSLNNDAINIIQQIKLQTKNNLQHIPNIKKTIINPDIKLNTNKDISNFLDNLLDNNKSI